MNRLAVIILLLTGGCSYLPRFPRPATTEDVTLAEGRIKEQMGDFNGRLGKQWEVIAANAKDVELTKEKLAALERDSFHSDRTLWWLIGLTVVSGGAVAHQVKRGIDRRSGRDRRRA